LIALRSTEDPALRCNVKLTRFRKGDMEQPKQPSKEDVRRWLRRELEQHKAPPNPEQIRRELGWDLVRLERGAPHKR
jgi:hypothetical protein